MVADWYCEINGAQHGPVTAAQLRQLAVEKKLRPSNPVWKEGMQKKVPALTVKGLFDAPSAKATKRAPAAPKQEEELTEFEMLNPEDAEEVEELEFELASPANDLKKKAAVAPKAATPTGGKSFRIMSGGRVRGPFSLQEIRNLFAAGKLGDGDLIGVETWLPAATLAGLVEAGPGVGKRPAPAARAKVEEVEVVEEVEEEADFEIVEEEVEKVPKQAPVARSDDDSIPVDDEFQLG